ncbi:MAG: hypothetical protein JWN34_4297 [Bryobacterales bacterium]|nr:hypothetical protein [Bryobacterales bacterium]
MGVRRSAVVTVARLQRHHPSSGRTPVVPMFQKRMPMATTTGRVCFAPSLNHGRAAYTLDDHYGHIYFAPLKYQTELGC